MSIDANFQDLELEDEEGAKYCCLESRLSCCDTIRIACVGFRKACTFLISHVGLILLVAGYCLIGAFTFERLEYENEQRVKKSIMGLRGNFTEDVWQITNELSYLRFENWSDSVHKRMKEFEHSILSSIKVDGWNGYEDPNKNEWTFAGALFYSIVVVTTIGYGDQTPKTDAGKLATVIFAILGIPLMLFCLTNTGDAMASSFRFFYWKVCCILCTNRGNNRASSRGGRSSSRSGTRGRALRRRPTTLSKGSGISVTPRLTRSFSVRNSRRLRRIATEDLSLEITSRENNLDPSSPNIDQGSSNMETPSPSSDGCKKDADFIMKAGDSKPERRDSKKSQKSLRPSSAIDIAKAASTDSSYSNLPISSPTTGGKNFFGPHLSPSIATSSAFYYPSTSSKTLQRGGSFRVYKSSDECDFSGSGTGGLEFVATFTADEEFDFEKRSIPLWVCMFWVLSYVAGGAVLFSGWEGWTLLDSSYFCFITLTTIGFGDYVPKTNKKVNAEVSILFCSIYLLFGMSLLVMTFNLVQDEVIFKVRMIAHKLGIINDEEMYDFQEN